MYKKGDIMFKSRFQWQLLSQEKIENQEQLIKTLLDNRNINDESEKKQFLSEELFLYDPYLFNDMDIVVKRIKEAINSQEKIMLYGDFDVDGVTGVAILYKALIKLGANVFYYIPSRFTEGYGPNKEAFSTFVEKGFKLIITIDNGISGIEEANYLWDNQVDLIITDHHEIGSILPKAYAFIHPKMIGENYPFKDLSGCGVAFKIAQALLDEIPYDLIDLAALGTYNDLVSLKGENRSIVTWGIKQLKNTTHLGLRILMQMLNINEIDEFTFGYILGPRLNAPGRMDNGNVAVRFLITEDYMEAKNLAMDIESFNQDRKTQIDIIFNEAITEIEKNKLDKFNVIVVSNDNWHEGVLGVVASRLVDYYHKPVIILTLSQGYYKGSARTLDDFPLYENLLECSELFVKFGGHKMACGLTIVKENLDKLRSKLHSLCMDNLQSHIKIEACLKESLIDFSLIDVISKFRPFGKDNEKPLFLLENMKVISVYGVGEEKKHLKLSFKKNNLILDAIAFNFGKLCNNINNNDLLDIVGYLEINEFNGMKTLQLRVVDIRCIHLQIFDFRKKQMSSDSLPQDTSNIYFTNHYNFPNPIVYSNDLKISGNVAIIDIPSSLKDLYIIVSQDDIQNIYLFFKSDEMFSSLHLLTREKLARLYQIMKPLKRFNKDDVNIIQSFERMGFNKKIQSVALQVFFELDFVIIERNEVIVIEKPQKRDLTESYTFRKIKEQVELKEKLLLYSQDELKNLIYKMINKEVF